LALKASFAVEEEGFDENVDEANEENRLLAFINYIKVGENSRSIPIMISSVVEHCILLKRMCNFVLIYYSLVKSNMVKPLIDLLFRQS
jgi:hypothetical protein